MSLENAHKLIRIYMGSLIVGVNTLYTLSCFLKQFTLVCKGLTTDSYSDIETGVFFISAIPLSTPLSCCSIPDSSSWDIPPLGPLPGFGRGSFQPISWIRVWVQSVKWEPPSLHEDLMFTEKWGPPKSLF